MRRSLVVLLGVACAASLGLTAPRPKAVTLSGQVVAYSGFLLCTNGNSYGSIILKISKHRRNELGFARVELSGPCGSPPLWDELARLREFRLKRHTPCDARLEQFMNVEPRAAEQFPTWRRFPGAETEALPFGQVLACYHSSDMPIAPVL